jgi:hypothetical protein
LHPRHGPQHPSSGAPRRLPGSVRRTSTVDNLRAGGVLGPVRVRARARDLITGSGGSSASYGSWLEASVDFVRNRELTAVASDPADSRLSTLIGAPVTSGFRSRAEQAVPEHAAACSRLHLLLDDLPVATLVGGYAISAAAERDEQVSAALALRRHKGTPDICAGWRNDGSIMVEVRRSGQPPIVTGPPAPELAPPDDPLAWHGREPLPPHSMRRARLLDVTPADGPGSIRVHSLFRDSHVNEDGLETVVHEYTVEATVDAQTLLVSSCAATVQVLPWVECPAAADSAGRLVGMPVRHLRNAVRTEFVGITTCTHLNDQLRSLADVPALLALIA